MMYLAFVLGALLLGHSKMTPTQAFEQYDTTITALAIPPVPYDEHDQDTLRDMMQTATDARDKLIAALGVTPPWREPDELEEDVARLLSAVADNWGLQWPARTGGVFKDPQPDEGLFQAAGVSLAPATPMERAIVADTLSKIGVSAVGNAKAIIEKAKHAGYIHLDIVAGNVYAVINLTQSGRDALDEYEDRDW